MFITDINELLTKAFQQNVILRMILRHFINLNFQIYQVLRNLMILKIMSKYFYLNMI